jgi:S-adenosylmethionine synthetase
LIIESLKLKNPIYAPTASYGHFGRESYTKEGLEFFPWEKTDKEESLIRAIVPGEREGAL